MYSRTYKKVTCQSRFPHLLNLREVILCLFKPLKSHFPYLLPLKPLIIYYIHTSPNNTQNIEQGDNAPGSFYPVIAMKKKHSTFKNRAIDAKMSIQQHHHNPTEIMSDKRVNRCI